MGEVRGFAEEDHYFDELGALVVDYYRTSDRLSWIEHQILIWGSQVQILSGSPMKSIC